MDVKIINDVVLRNDIITIILTAIIPVTISIVALVISISSYFYNKRKSKIEKAVIQAGKYKNIINDISVISFIIVSNSKIFKIVDKIEYIKMNYFTRDELEEYFTATELKDLELFFVELNIKLQDNFISISKFLNTLEEFAMYFTQNIADHKTVYQSLHNSYLLIVKYLYYSIAKNNREKKETEKFYTNITTLFIIWRNKQAKMEQKIKNINEKSQKKNLSRTMPKPKI